MFYEKESPLYSSSEETFSLISHSLIVLSANFAGKAGRLTDNHKDSNLAGQLVSQSVI